MLGDRTESTGTKLQTIVQFFSVSVKLFEAESDGKADNELVRMCINPILELVYRTYTDEQMTEEVKLLSTELVDTLAEKLEKAFFID